MSMKIKKEDLVLVIAGKDRGKTGKVLTVFPTNEKLVIAGISLIKKHIKKSKKFPEGGRVELPGKVDASNVMVICPNCKKATRVAYTNEKNNKTRVCRKCSKPLGEKN